MIYELKARIKHLWGAHTPVQDVRNPGLWCYVCGKRL